MSELVPVKPWNCRDCGILITNRAPHKQWHVCNKCSAVRSKAATLERKRRGPANPTEAFNTALDDFQKQLREFVANNRGDALEAPHPVQIYSELLGRFGGLDAFCDMWYQQIEFAMRVKPGEKVTLDQFWKLSQFAVQALEMRDTAPDVAGLSEEDLNQEILRILGPKLLPVLKAVDYDSAASLVEKIGDAAAREAEAKKVSEVEEEIEDADFDYLPAEDADEAEPG
jgi:hypothetical protein